MIWYGVPATTEGSSSPAWILWIITCSSSVLPVSGSVLCAVWHISHWSTAV